MTSLVRRPREALAVCVLAVVSLLMTSCTSCGGSSTTLGSLTGGSPAGGGAPAGGSAPAGGGTPAGGAPTNTSAATFNHVFLVVLENSRYSDIVGSPEMPFLNSLIQHYAIAANYYANTHPSIGNYLMMTTGQIITNDDAFSGTVTADNMARELASAGKSWKVYAENLPSPGYTGGDALPYVRRHNPFSYFSDVVGTSAASNIVPFGNLSADLASGNLPNFVYIEPNVFDDMHNCPPSKPVCTLADRRAFCDAWLHANIAPILANSAFNNDGVLIVTFDEGMDTDLTNGGGQILTLVASPRAKAGYTSTTFYQHQSLLRLMLEGLGVSTLPGAAASAPKMSEFFQ